MSASFVTGLRTRDRVLQAGEAGGEQLRLRVEMPEVWDVVRVDARAGTPILQVKEAALKALYPTYADHAEFVMKLNGFEVLDEAASIADSGGVDGSIYLLTFRRRRPVR